MPEQPLEDSIRSAQRSHRSNQATEAIQARIQEERALRRASASGHQVQTTGVRGPNRVRPANQEDSLPLSPAKAAALGMTLILPPMQVRQEEKFRRFLHEVLTNPDLRADYPTYTSLSAHFGVSVQTIKTWLLSEEVGKALRSSMSHEALMSMPSVLRSVRLRAELTGDPHAAEFVRKVAKLGTAETDAQSSFEKTLREIAHERMKTNAALPRPVQVIEARVVETARPQEDVDNPE